MPKAEALSLSLNAMGSLVGTCGGARRVAAHLWVFKSATTIGAEYMTYVVSLVPKTYRCACPIFLVTGKCKHGEAAVHLERTVKRVYPHDYVRERIRTNAMRQKPITYRPYVGPKEATVT